MGLFFCRETTFFCEMKERQLDYGDERDAGARDKIHLHRYPIWLVLDRIQDPRNLGALFRLADAARLAGLIAWQMDAELLGSKAKRISRSTWKTLPIQFVSEMKVLDELLEGFARVALERTDQSLEYWSYDWPDRMALFLGHEEEGLGQKLLDTCQASLHLPMYGLNTSMNVAMAAGIATYECLRKRPAPNTH